MLQNLARVDEVEVRLREVGRALLRRRASMVPSDETNIKHIVEDALERARDLGLPLGLLRRASSVTPFLEGFTAYAPRGTLSTEHACGWRRSRGSSRGRF
jgi:hypothetical protein